MEIMATWAISISALVYSVFIYLVALKKKNKKKKSINDKDGLIDNWL